MVHCVYWLMGDKSGPDGIPELLHDTVKIV